jgi:hypothetical protein
VFFYLNGLHLHEALKFFSWFTSSFCCKDILKVSFFLLVSFQFWWTSWDGAPCGCHFVFFSSKQLAIFLLLAFVYLFSPSTILVVYNANVLLVVAFFNNVDRHCCGTRFLLVLIVLIVIARAWCLLHHCWCSKSFIALAIPFYAFCFVLFLNFFSFLFLLICLWFHVCRSFSIF